MSITRNLKIIVLALICAGALLTCGRADAQDIRVMTSGAFTAAFNELTPVFEGATGHKILTTYGGSMGSAPDAIPNRLQRGEPADIVIMAASALDDLIKQGKVVSGSRVDLVRSTIGAAVRAGAPKPDISSVDALRRALLQAKSIAYSSSASGVYLSTELFPRLGIADQIAAKSKKVDSDPVGLVVARGEAELGFQQISELRPVKGIDIVGPLPGDAQRVTIFSAGIVASAKQPAAAKRLIAFLASPAAAPAIARSGLEPITQASASSSGAASCESLASLTLPSTTITLARIVEAGAFTPPAPAGAPAPPSGAQAFRDMPAFCRVTATLKPSSDSVIKIEVWLPASGWNGKFEAVGNGGWAGVISYAALATAVRRGYATASTDTGHRASDSWWAVGHPEKVVDYLYRAKHLVTVAAKGLMATYYGRPASRSYFNSCSNGGRQGLMEAQRYPDDYDGIVAGAPWNFQSHSNAGFVWNAQALSAPGAAISAAKLPALNAAALAACDGNDGLVDGVIANPATCRFNPAVLLCQGAETDA